MAQLLLREWEIFAAEKPPVPIFFWLVEQRRWFEIFLEVVEVVEEALVIFFVNFWLVLVAYQVLQARMTDTHPELNPRMRAYITCTLDFLIKTPSDFMGPNNPFRLMGPPSSCGSRSSSIQGTPGTTTP